MTRKINQGIRKAAPPFWAAMRGEPPEVSGPDGHPKSGEDSPPIETKRSHRLVSSCFVWVRGQCSSGRQPFDFCCDEPRCSRGRIVDTVRVNSYTRIDASVDVESRRDLGAGNVATEVLFISMAARELGMHPQTLRKYERLGLVRPTRTIGSMRIYSRGGDPATADDSSGWSMSWVSTWQASSSCSPLPTWSSECARSLTKPPRLPHAAAGERCSASSIG